MNPFRSWLGALNFLVLQWAFIRLQEHGDIVDGAWVHERWSILWGVIPLTGWWTRYLRLWNAKSGKLLG